jgi:hypothetical protein
MSSKEKMGPGSRLLHLTLGGRGAPFRWGGLRPSGLGGHRQTRPTGHLGKQTARGVVPAPITREQLRKGQAQLGRARPIRGGTARHREECKDQGGYRPHQGHRECLRREECK